MLFLGNLRSVDVLRSLYEVLCEFFLNRLRRYGGTSSFRLLKTIVLDLLQLNEIDWMGLYKMQRNVLGTGQMNTTFH